MATKKTTRYILLVALVAGVFSFHTSVSASSDATRIRIDKATIKKGYTVAHSSQALRFAITPGQVDQEVNVTLKTANLDDTPLPIDKQLSSQVYSFDMMGREYNPIITTRPSWIAIHYTTSSNINKAVYYWDNNRGAWVELPSRIDRINKYVQAITHLPFSKVAILEEAPPQEEYTGVASWYESGEEMTAAMNQFELGDTVKVTNLDNNKSCLVRIIDRGPDIAGRIIDLSDDAFGKLAPLSWGLIEVKVEKY